VPYTGKLKDNLEVTLAKIKATISTCGALNIKDFQKTARLTVVSNRTIAEGGIHDILTKEMGSDQWNS
jgi:IMP dehydrogenase